MRIGDSYQWPASGSTSRIAGFFYRLNDKKIYMLTAAPLEVDVRNGLRIEELICWVPWQESHPPDNQTQDSKFILDQLNDDPIPFASQCLIYEGGIAYTAKVVGTHCVAMLDGKLCEGLYELETLAHLHGMAGAPVIYAGLLSGIVIGDGGKTENGLNRALVRGLDGLKALEFTLLHAKQSPEDGLIDEDFLSGMERFLRSAAA